MNQLKTIFAFELRSYFKNKFFVGFTVLIIVLSGILLSVPRFLPQDDASQQGADETVDSPEEVTDIPKILLVDTTFGDSLLSQTLFESAFPDNEIVTGTHSVEEIQSAIKSEEYESAIYLISATEYTYYTPSLGMYDSTSTIVDELMKNLYQTQFLSEAGLSEEEISTFMSTTITSNVEVLGENQGNPFTNFMFTYILVFLLYISVVAYGSIITTSVATEKSSRAMEILITSAKPNSLIFGKILGAACAGLIQFALMLGSAALFFQVNSNYWSGNEIVNSIFQISPLVAIYAFLFFLLGFLLYAFLFGASGSLVSKVEDANTVVMPVLFLFVICFIVVITNMSNGNIDSMLITILSYVPFTSPMAMFARITMSNVAVYEIIISILILIATTIGIGIFAAKIYRMGVLLYGNPPKPKEIVKMLFSKES